MAIRFSDGEGCPEFLDGPPSDRRRDEYSRLSLLAHYQEGSDGNPRVRGRPRLEKTYPPLRNDAGHGSDPGKRLDHNGTGTVHGGGLRAGDDGNGDVGEGMQSHGLREVKALDGSEFPNVPHGHWGPTGEAAPGTAIERVRDSFGVLDANSLLNELSKLSLEELLDLVLNTPWDARNIDMSRLKMEAIRIGLLTQTKVDDTMMRKRGQDLMPQLVDKIMEGRAARPAVEVQAN